MFDVYMLTCSVSCKSYIGISDKGGLRRLVQHRRAAESGAGNHLYRAMRKHGIETFALKIIYQAVDYREAIACERAMIAQYGTFSPAGYNMTTGGENNVGYHLCKEVREKQRQGKLGKLWSNESREKLSKARIGHKWSDESKEKKAAWHRGRPWTPLQRKMQEAVRLTPEYRAKMKIARSKRSQTNFTPELRARISAAVSRNHANPIMKEIQRLNTKAHFNKDGLREKYKEQVAELKLQLKAGA